MAILEDGYLVGPDGNPSPVSTLISLGGNRWIAHIDTNDGLFWGSTDGVNFRYLGWVDTGTPAFVVAGGKLFFSAEGEDPVNLYVTDGVTFGFIGIDREGEGSNARDLTVFGDRVIFTAFDGDYYSALYISDGTRAGTFRLGDVDEVDQFLIIDGRIFYAGYGWDEERGSYDWSIWVSDGTREGSHEVEGPYSGEILDLRVIGGQLVFTTRGSGPDGYDEYRYWTTDGTTEGTVPFGGEASFTGGAGPDVYDAASVMLETLVTARGNGGADRLWGHAGRDLLYGGDGNDRLFGRGGNDVIEGGAGDDWIDGGRGRDVLAGGAGVDTLDLTDRGPGDVDLQIKTMQQGGVLTISGFENIRGSSGTDRLSGDLWANRLEGMGGQDTLSGRGGDDYLDGGEGNDTVSGGAGNDVLIGGGGSDTADYGDIQTGVTVSLGATGPQATGGGGIDTLFGFENLRGSKGADVLSGDGEANQIKGESGDDRIFGGGGRDTLQGDSGNDVLDGGDGVDILAGGAGIDLFVFTSAEGDTIKDWQAGEKIDVSALVDSAAGLRLVHEYGRTFVTFDTDGDGAFDDGSIVIVGTVNEDAFVFV